MIRIFSHYISRQSMQRVGFDLAFLLLAMLAAFVAFADRGPGLPQAGRACTVGRCRPVRRQHRRRASTSAATTSPSSRRFRARR
jgi:hypothetical protein